MNRFIASQREKDILACIELDSELSIVEIASKLRIKPHTVQYHYNRMRQDKIIKPVLFVDIHRLGLRYFGTFLSIRGSSTALQKFIAVVSQHPCVGWFAEVSGSFQFGIAIAVTTPKEADEQLQQFISKSGVSVAKKAATFRLQLVDMPRGYLSTKISNRGSLSMLDGVSRVELDDLDMKILAALNLQPWESNRGVARRLGIPHSSLELRLKRMRTSEVIRGRTIEISLAALGRECRKLLLYTRGRSSQFEERLLQWAIRHPLVSHFVSCLGEWDFEVNVEVADSQELNAVCQALYMSFPDEIVTIEPLGIISVHRYTRTPIVALKRD